MPVHPKDLLLLSKSLLNNAYEEAQYRTCSNRAYYASFQECCRIAPKATGYKPPTKNPTLGHTELHQLLSSHESKTPSKHRSHEDKIIIMIGVMLAQCFNLRVKADYRFNDTFTLNQAQTSILIAEKILQEAQYIP